MDRGFGRRYGEPREQASPRLPIVSNTTVLVTGAAGFIGAAVAERLLRRGDAVVGIDRLDDYYDVALKNARRARVTRAGGDRFSFLELDFANFANLEAELSDLRFDAIVHLGAQPGVRYSIDHPLVYAHSNLV